MKYKSIAEKDTASKFAKDYYGLLFRNGLLAAIRVDNNQTRTLPSAWIAWSEVIRRHPVAFDSQLSNKKAEGI